jgi:hypothetical protein
MGFEERSSGGYSSNQRPTEDSQAESPSPSDWITAASLSSGLHCSGALLVAGTSCPSFCHWARQLSRAGSLRQ